MAINTLYEYNEIGKMLRVALIDIEMESIQKVATQSILDLSVKLDLNQ
jgi:hypothetical protein